MSANEEATTSWVRGWRDVRAMVEEYWRSDGVRLADREELMPSEEQREQERRIAAEQQRRIAEAQRQKLVAQQREKRDKQLKKK